MTTILQNEACSLKVQVELLQQDYEQLSSNMHRYLEEKHIANFPTIRNSIAFLPASTKFEQIPLFGLKQQAEILSSLTFSEIVSPLKNICKFPNISLLEHLVHLFGDEGIQAHLISYLKKLQVFRKQTKVKEFTKVCQLDSTVPLEFLSLTIELKCEWHRSTLEDIELLCRSVVQKSSLMSYGVQVVHIEWDQGLLHLSVPSRAMECIMKSINSTFLQENHIEIWPIGGKNTQSAQTIGNAAFTFPVSEIQEQTRQPPSSSQLQYYTHVLQFNPTDIESKQQISSHSIIYPTQTVAVPIISPQVVPSHNGLSGSNMAQLAMPIMQYPRSPQLHSYAIVPPEQLYLPSPPSTTNILCQPVFTNKATPIKCQVCDKPLQSAGAYTCHLRQHMKMKRRRKTHIKKNVDDKTCRNAVEIVIEAEGREHEEIEVIDRERAQRVIEEEAPSPSPVLNYALDSASQIVETAKHSSTTSPLPAKTSIFYKAFTETANNTTGNQVLPGPLPSFDQLVQSVESKEDCRRDLKDSSQKGLRHFRCCVCGRHLSSQLALNAHVQSMHAQATYYYLQ